MGIPDQPRQPGDVPPEWFEWRGGVNVKLDTLGTNISAVDKKVDKNSDTLEKMPADIEERIKNVINGAPAPSGLPITFKWFTEKLLLPIVLLVASLVIAAALASG